MLWRSLDCPIQEQGCLGQPLQWRNI
ncbi:MAG: hypothetical protein ABW107_01110, partial [Candidatus Thiodiazotropha sp. 6PLUC5]